MANDSSKFTLVIAGESKTAEAALQRVRDQYGAILPITKQAAANFREAAAALDVRPMRLVSQEVNVLRESYQRLAQSGLLSQSELAKAATNLKAKTEALRTGQTSLNGTMTSGEGITGRLVGAVGRLVGAYSAYRAVSAFYSAVIDGSRDAEQAQFALEASVQAAGREFANTGGLDQWQGKVREISADLRIYSETDVANATARTIDMTKRLGLSADQMDVLIRRTADLSAGKTDLEGGVERVTAALRGEAEASEYLGLTLNETYVKSWYEANNATGAAWSTLTDLEKAQVRYNVLLEQSAALQGRAADSSRTFNGALQLMHAQISNAIANNEDLGDALARIATLITDNADEIAKLTATFAGAVGDVIKFTIENKELLGVLIGSGGLVFMLSKTAGAVTGIATAIKAVGGLKIPEFLGTGGTLTLKLAARISIYLELIKKIGETVYVLWTMVEAQDEAAAAAHRLALAEAEAQGVADAATNSTGLQIDSITELNRLLREGVVVLDKQTSQYLTFEQAQTKAAAATERQAQAEIDRGKSFEQITAIVERATQKYGDLSAEAITAADQQNILNAALTSIKSPVEAAGESVDALGNAYYDAATALESLSLGQAGYEAALDKKLKSEAAYVKAVEDMRDTTLRTMTYRQDDEERALQQSLDRKLLLEEDRLQQGFITQTEYDKLKIDAEETMAGAIFAMREETVAKSKELYGEDSQEYRDAVFDKVDAELDLKKATNASEAANQTFIDSLASVGPAGEEGGGRAAAALRDVGAAADDATAQVNGLTAAQKKSTTADFFGAQYSAIQQTMADFESLDEMATWANQVVTQKNGTALTNKDIMYGVGATGSSSFTKATNQYAQDLYIQRLNELSAAPTASPTASSISSESTNTIGASTGGKIMTVNLTAGSRTVATSVSESDAGALLEVLRQAGMVTA